MNERVSSMTYPLTFDPVFKDYPWGGQNLRTELGRSIPDGVVAESWDIAAHANGSSVVNNGPLKGYSLQEVQSEWGVALLGKWNAAALEEGVFPLLIKLLDANRWLSVQVHPADDYPRKHEGEYGKTEMWVVLRAKPGSELIYGFRPGVDRERFAEAIGDDQSSELLQRLAVEQGDVVFVPAGTVHALGPGIIVAEIQQNSDTTYRIYDWGRPRPLHIEEALEVLNFDLLEPAPVIPQLLEENGFVREELAACSYFHTERLRMLADREFAGRCDGSTFEIWGVMEGTVTIQWSGAPLEVGAIGWVLLPAALGAYTVVGDNDAVLLRVYSPERP